MDINSVKNPATGVPLLQTGSHAKIAGGTRALGSGYALNDVIISANTAVTVTEVRNEADSAAIVKDTAAYNLSVAPSSQGTGYGFADNEKANLGTTGAVIQVTEITTELGDITDTTQVITAGKTYTIDTDNGNPNWGNFGAGNGGVGTQFKALATGNTGAGSSVVESSARGGRVPSRNRPDAAHRRQRGTHAQCHFRGRRRRRELARDRERGVWVL